MPQPTEPTATVRLILNRLNTAMQRMTRTQSRLVEHRAERDRAIADLRVAGWTVRQVAEHTGLSNGQISNIDREQGVFTTRVARKG